jgi:hypothetical protein
MIGQTKKAAVTNKCVSVVGHFDGHEDQVVDAEGITRPSMSRAILEATGLRHRASICPVLPRRMPWSSILV